MRTADCANRWYYTRLRVKRVVICNHILTPYARFWVYSVIYSSYRFTWPLKIYRTLMVSLYVHIVHYVLVKYIMHREYQNKYAFHMKSNWLRCDLSYCYWTKLIGNVESLCFLYDRFIKRLQFYELKSNENFTFCIKYYIPKIYQR